MCMYMYMHYMYVQVCDSILILFIVTSIRLPWPGLAMSSSHKSQKLVTGVRLESTINAVIEGICVHRSVKLFLVLLRGHRGAPQSLSMARTPHARPSLCPRKIPAGTRGVPYPPRGASYCTRGGLELLVAGTVHVECDLRIDVPALYQLS